MDLQAIKNRWDATEKLYQNLSFEQAQADMHTLMAEVEKLKDIENKAFGLSLELSEAKLRYKNVQQQIVDEIGAIVRKYDTF